MKRILMLLAVVMSALHAGGGVVSYLRFEENGGAVAHDETGLLDGDLVSFSANQMTPGGGDFYGRGWSADVPGATVPLTGEANTTSMRMNGGSGYIDLSNYNHLLLGYSFTIEMFIKPDTVIGSSVALGFSDPLGHGFGFLLLEEQDGFMYGFDNGVEDLTFDARSPLLQIGVWQHIAIVKQPGISQFFINGVLADENNFTPDSTPYILLGDATLGTRTIGGESGTWRGWIDEFRISDEALMPSQFLNAPIPEPGTLSLLLLGLPSLCFARRIIQARKP